MAGWQDSFVPDPQTPQAAQAAQATGWQSSFVPDGQQSQPQQEAQSNYLPGEDIARQIGLTGRYMLEGPAGLVTGPSDILGAGINYGTGKFNQYAGTDIPKVGSATEALSNALTKMGYPEPQGGAEKLVAGLSKFVAGTAPVGTSTINTIKEAYGNAMDMLPASTEESGIITPKSSDIKLIKEKLDLAGITPQQYARALQESSPEDFAGELGGDPLRMQTQAQAKITSPVMQEARDAMRQRLAEAPQRTANIIGEAIKPEVNVQNMLQNIQDMDAQLSDLYKASDADIVPSSIVSDIIHRPAGQQAIAATAEKLSNQGLNSLDAGIVKGADGSLRFTPDVPVKTLDEFQRSLGDLVQRNPITGAIEDSSSSTIEGMRKSVTLALAGSSSSYQKALNVAAAKQQAESAFDMGRQLAKSAAGEKADAIMERAAEVMSPNELSYQKAGYAQGLTDASQGAALGGSPVSRIATGKVQNTAASIIQNPTEAQRFADALMQEKNRIDLAQRGLGGSNTAETFSAGTPEIPTSVHGVALSAINKVKDWALAGKNERLAQLLYATSPEQKAILAQKVLGK